MVRRGVEVRSIGLGVVDNAHRRELSDKDGQRFVGTVTTINASGLADGTTVKNLRKCRLSLLPTLPNVLRL